MNIKGYTKTQAQNLLYSGGLKIMTTQDPDIQNILNSKYKEQDVYIKTGKILNPDAPLDQQRYELKPVERRTGTLLPSIGLMIEF